MKNLLRLLIILGLSAQLQAADSSYEQLLRRVAPEGEVAVPVPAPSVPRAVLPAIDDNARYWVTAYAADKYERTALLEAGLDIVEIGNGKVSGLAHARTVRDLSSRKSVTLESAVSLEQYQAAMRGYTKDFPAADAAYHNYRETTDLLKDMAARNSDIASVFSIGKTTEGRDIWCLRINSTAKGTAASSKPGAFYLGNLHAREHLANEVPLLFAAYLLDHKNDADIKKYIASLDIFIVPMGNPDGVEFDISTGRYQMFRKNMRTNSDGSKGVDLNRNFDSWWCQEGASHSEWSDTYCGPSAFSEPESQAIKRFFEARPNIKTHITYHSYGGQVLYPWGGSEDEVPDTRDRAVFVKAAQAMASYTGYRPEKSSDMYVATGDSADWAYAATKAFAFTFELEGRGFYPGAAIITTAVEKNIRAAVYLLSITDNPYKII